MTRYKLIVPILIIFVIIGIWFFKSSEKRENEAMKDNTKFALDATDYFDMEELKSYGLPIIVAFGSDSCPPCREMYPALEAVNKAYKGKVLVKFVDVWKNQEAAIDFPVKVIPTQFFFNSDGSPVVPKNNEEKFIFYSREGTNEHIYTAHEGPMSKEKLIEVIKEMEEQ